MVALAFVMTPLAVYVARRERVTIIKPQAQRLDDHVDDEDEDLEDFSDGDTSSSRDDGGMGG